MTNPLTEDYLSWLMPQIREITDGSRNSNKTFEMLCRIMFEKEFVWTVANDDNRMGDGLALRVEFCYERHIHVDARDELLDYCSFLEVLIGLSRRLSFIAGGSAPSWAWQLLSNLQLTKMSDPIGRSRARKVNDILDRCIWRLYDENGYGGFFPLTWPNEDQTKVELWYQMARYIDELPEI